MKLKIALTLIYLAMNIGMNGQDKLIYIGDPMCSWCYGFAPQLDKIVKQYKGQLEIELVTGGLRPYNKTPIGEMKDFLSNHWKEVNKATQQAFNYNILDRHDLVYDTEPACRAVVVVRNMNPAKEIEFFKLAQEAFYFQNKNLGEAVSYYPILDSLSMDKELFTQRFNSEEYKTLVQKDFERSTQLGVRGFPTLLLVSKGHTTVLSRGYTTATQIEELIKATVK